MATALHPRVPEVTEDGLFSSLTRLAQLELELGVAETRQTLIAAAIAVGAAVLAAIALVASLVVLIAAGVAPLVGARWEHLLVAGGFVLLAAAATLGWGVWRLKSLQWPRLTLASLEENWQWLGAQLRSRLRLR